MNYVEYSFIYFRLPYPSELLIEFAHFNLLLYVLLLLAYLRYEFVHRSHDLLLLLHDVLFLQHWCHWQATSLVHLSWFHPSIIGLPQLRRLHLRSGLLQSSLWYVSVLLTAHRNDWYLVLRMYCLSLLALV